MSESVVRAHLNLYAVLQNIEDLLLLDAEAASWAKDWDLSLQFAVRGGPAAHLVFRNGRCTHAIGTMPSPDISLYFLTHGHLNALFDGKGVPIPLKGFSRLGFLQKDFTRLTDRLQYFLRPDAQRLADPAYLRINTHLTLNTALFAVKELAAHDPASKTIAAHIPHGILQVEVRPDGPCAFLEFSPQGIRAAKGVCASPAARMTFRDIGVANALLTNQLDAFLAVAQGSVILEGMLPMIDNTNLILDRVPAYLA
ncbi:MAG TPA: hypothetical protein PK967_11780 [Candidatus Hydrogenedentes bacterium]|nr:hypothetical protein [Candidatus Hydrogenedentota bacterium]